MSLRVRFALLLSMILLVVTLGSGAAAGLLGRSDAARSRHDRQLADVANTEQLRVAYLAQADAMRDFLLTGDESHLRGYEAARSDEARLVRQLTARELTSDQAARLDRVLGQADRWQTDAVVPLIAVRRTGDVESAVAQYEAVDSVELFTELEAEIDSLVSRLSAQAIESNAAAGQARRDAARLGLGIVLAAVALTATATVAVRRWVTSPLAELGSSVRLVHDGDLSTRIAAAGPPEIAALGTEIELLRERLAVELDTSLRSVEGLAQNASVLLSVRSRLESAPELMPSGWSVAASLTPATGVVAGDCYDVGRIGASRLGIVVVDVAGHGAESAVGALRAKELLRASIRTYADLGEGVRWVNNQFDGLASDMFVTAFVAILDTATGRVDYVGAGHPPALLCGTESVLHLGPTGPLIGPFEAMWHGAHTVVEEGQTLVIYTDGLTELRDENRGEFGLDRLTDLVCYEFDDAEAVVKRCLDEATAFSSLRGQDDVTIVAVSRARSSGVPVGSNG